MTRPIMCANTQHRRVGGLRSVEAADGRVAAGVWTYYQMSAVSGRPIARRRAICAVCHKDYDPAWHERYARDQGLPVGFWTEIVQ